MPAGSKYYDVTTVEQIPICGWKCCGEIGSIFTGFSLLKTKFRNTHMRDDSSGHKTIRR